MTVMELMRWALGLNMIPGLILFVVGFLVFGTEAKEAVWKKELSARGSLAVFDIPSGYKLLPLRLVGLSYLAMLLGAWWVCVGVIAVFRGPATTTYGPFALLGIAHIFATLVLLAVYGYYWQQRRRVEATQRRPVRT
jgi:hypothetical protein